MLDTLSVVLMVLIALGVLVIAIVMHSAVDLEIVVQINQVPVTLVGKLNN